MNRITTFAVAALAAITLASCVPVDEPGTAADRAVESEQSQQAEASTAPETPATPVAKKKKSEPAMTTSQKNAVGSAAGYLDFDAFSRVGLIKQLKFEGFSKADATFAVDYIKPDYNVQAVKSAKDYLDYDSFSRKGLIQQLEFEGYTHKQAVYGANKTGL